MDRRSFHLQLMSTLAALALPATAQPARGGRPSLAEHFREIEAGVTGRLGVAVLDTAGGRMDGHRLDERFPMCSTFKWLASALVLQRVDQGAERLDRRIAYGRDVLLPHSPVTERHVGEGMTLGELCEATITVSDNAAANLILGTYGGPRALTLYARRVGDLVTRLDRLEPELNEATPGDPRDTTSPRAMARLLQRVMLGDALSPAGRAQLVRWMEMSRTNRQRLGANLPAGWRLGSKTGTGALGTTNDVGVFWPPGRAPIVVAVYLTQTTAPEAARNSAVAQVAHSVATDR